MTGASNSSNRQWPDIMMWILVLALLLGFFLMLVTGKRGSDVRATPTNNTSNETTVIPSSPGTIDSNSNSTTTPSAPATAAVSQGLTQEEIEGQAAANTNSAASNTTRSVTNTTNGNSSTTGTTGNEAQTSSIPPAPSSPPVAPIEPPVLPENLTSTSGESSVAGDVNSAATAPVSDSGKESPPARPKVTTIPPRRSGGAVPVSQNRTPLRSDFRIMLGTFGSNNTLRGSTANISNLGYTVHSIDVGDQLVAQVGPFANEESARQALQDIHQVYSGALLYRPKGYTEKVVKPEGRAPAPPPIPANKTVNTPPTPTRVNQVITTNASTKRSQTAQVPSRQTQTTPTTNTPEPIPQKPRTSTPVTRPASTGAMYLQVGAFEKEESAQRMVTKLRDTGFAPVVNAPEGNKVTVVVGPYGNQDLAQAEARLDQAGIDHFRFR